jgi:hypothetical protein
MPAGGDNQPCLLEGDGQLSLMLVTRPAGLSRPALPPLRGIRTNACTSAPLGSCRLDQTRFSRCPSLEFWLFVLVAEYAPIIRNIPTRQAASAAAKVSPIELMLPSRLGRCPLAPATSTL